MDGQQIRQVRRRLGLAQSGLADKFDVDQGTVSRWERGIDSPRPSRISSLHELLRRDDTKRSVARALSLVRNDLKVAVFLDQDLRLREQSASARRFYRNRGCDPSKFIGKSFEDHAEVAGQPQMIGYLEQSGLKRGQVLHFRFAVKNCGQGHTTIYEPVFEGDPFMGMMGYMSARFDFPPNEEYTIELVDYVPAEDPFSLVTLYRGPRARYVGIGV